MSRSAGAKRAGAGERGQRHRWGGAPRFHIGALSMRACTFAWLNRLNLFVLQAVDRATRMWLAFLGENRLRRVPSASMRLRAAAAWRSVRGWRADRAGPGA